MSPPATVGFRPAGRRSHQRTTVGPADGIGESRREPRDRRRVLAAFSDCIGKRHQIVIVGVGRQRAGMADELPTAGSGDTSGVHDAQIPRVRLGHGGQRADDCRRV